MKKFEGYISDFGVTNAPDALPSQDAIEVCMQWIKKYARRRKTFNTGITSCELKYVVVQWADRYISDGAFIQAAINIGYSWRRACPHSPNAVFNMGFPRIQTVERIEAGFID